MGSVSARAALAIYACALACGGPERGTLPAAPAKVIAYGPLGMKADAKTPGRAVMLGTDDRNGSTVIQLAAGSATASVDAIELATAPNPEQVVQVRIRDARARTVGPEWRAGVWSSALVAATVLGKDLTDVAFSATSGSDIDDASASGLLAAGFLAALTGAPIDPAATLTGAIDPDGTIGPVAGLPEKFASAIASGKRRLGYPAGMRTATSDQTGQDVDLVALAKAHGAEAIEIADVRAAYTLLTRKALPTTLPVAEADMALDPSTASALEAKYKQWQQRVAAQWTAIEQATAGARPPQYVELLQKYARELTDKGEALHRRGLIGAAYSRALLAWCVATTAGEVLDVVAKVRARDYEGARAALVTIDKLGEETSAVFERIGALKPTTLGGHLQMLAAFRAAIDAWVDRSVAQPALASAEAALASLPNAPPAQLASPELIDQIANMVGPILLYATRSSAQSQFALEQLEFEHEDSVPYSASLAGVARMTSAFTSAGIAGLNGFDQLVIQPLAKRRGVDVDATRKRFTFDEPDYLVAYMAAKLGDTSSDGLPKDLATAWGDHSLAWELLSLAGSEIAYYNSAELLAKWYSLGAHTDDSGHVASVDHAQAFERMLAAAERNARANARAARIAAGAIPIQARLSYQLAMVERDGDVGEKLDALQELWWSSASSQTAVMLARN